jgi:hypothetical protein
MDSSPEAGLEARFDRCGAICTCALCIVHFRESLLIALSFYAAPKGRSFRIVVAGQKRTDHGGEYTASTAFQQRPSRRVSLTGTGVEETNRDVDHYEDDAWIVS